MRILHVVHQYFPEQVGGTELYTQTLAAYQAAKGFSVSVFYPGEGPRPYPDEEDGIRIYGLSVGQRTRQQVFQDTFRQPQIEQAFTAVLASEKPDIIHIQHLMGLPFGLVKQIARAGIPFVITLHDYWYGCANAQLITNTDNTICDGPNRIFSNCGRCALVRAGMADKLWLGTAVAPLMAYRNRQLRHILTRAHTVIAPTPFVHQTYQQMGLPTHNFQVIQHGIEVPQAKIERVLQEKAGQPPRDGLHIGFIGSLGWQKGVHVLITAVNQLPIENVTLTIYGGLDTFPDYVADLQQMARHPGITFAGRISRDDIWAALADLDVVVLPTLWYEASPLTIQEVFAVGIPLIASNIGAMPDKIRDGVDGLLFTPGDAEALHHILLDLYQHPEKVDALKAHIGPVYTMAQQVDDVTAVYQKALSK